MMVVFAESRKDRLDKLWAKAKNLASARQLAMQANDNGAKNDKWVSYGYRANKAASIAYAHTAKPSDETRRSRLASVLKTARSSLAASSSRSNAGKALFDKGVKALNIYQKRRYPNYILQQTKLAKGGQVFDPTSMGRISRRVSPLVIQKAGTAKPTFHQKFDMGPHYYHLWKSYRRLSKQVRSKSPAEQQQVKNVWLANNHLKAAPRNSAAVGPAEIKNGIVPHLDQGKRVSNPVIRRPVTPTNVMALGNNPRATVAKKPIGRRERKQWRRWSR